MEDIDPTGSAETNDPARRLDPAILGLLSCPETGEALYQLSATSLANESGTRKYRITKSGIPMFAEEFCTPEGKVQQTHYDRVAAAYLENLGYPHTQVYTEYLDNAFLEIVRGDTFGYVAEICCGRGEAFQLLDARVERGVGIDVSPSMLEAARKELADERYTFVQGDATMLPVRDGSFDRVVMFGGIHHVNDREKLFAEIFRILKPGGMFYWREPVSDFFLWRWLRAVIYRASSALDHSTERPLLYRETVPVLEKVGLSLREWRTYGFLGFCLFMNSDVLIFNRAFKFIPGVRGLTRAFAGLDDLMRRVPGLRNAGLQVIGAAQKPVAEHPRNRSF